MALNLIMLGPPGAGKGTQAERFARTRGIPKISTGDILREAVHAGTEVGKRAKAIMDRGELVSDDVMIGIVQERLERADALAGFVLDGFPRTVAQAEALDDLLDELVRELSIVFEFQVPDAVAVSRLLERARLENRTDDTPEVIGHRIRVFKSQTEPLIAYYRTRGILVGIHAERGVEAVSAEIQAALEHVGVR